MTDTRDELRAHAYITTYSGAQFRYNQPGPFRIRDIARSLSMTMRFRGHTSFPYSVAQHSVMVSRMLEQDGASIPEQAAGLLHDAHEAYVGDVPTPLKWECPELQALEASVATALRAALLPGVSAFVFDEMVKPYDTDVLHHEARVLLRPVPAWVRATSAWGYRNCEVRYLNPLHSEQEFLQRAAALGLV